MLIQLEASLKYAILVQMRGAIVGEEKFFPSTTFFGRRLRGILQNFPFLFLLLFFVVVFVDLKSERKLSNPVEKVQKFASGSSANERVLDMLYLFLLLLLGTKRKGISFTQVKLNLNEVLSEWFV